MRYITNIDDSKIKRLMIHSNEDGVYLFEYDNVDDCPAVADYWFEELDDAFDSCKEEYSVARNAWEEIPDSQENCQQDWIAPVRVVGRENGDPQWRRFEKLIDGKWIEI